MFGLLKNLQHKDALMRLYGEIKKNLEIYYVMDQRQFIDMEFQSAQWQKVQSQKGTAGLAKLKDYGRVVDDFNRFYREFKEFEKWYAADMNNKTKENAQKLHTHRSELDGKLKNMYPVICAAGEELEYKLIELKLIKQ